MNSQLFYRFRPIENLIGSYKELEDQYIYFASPDQLNDPMEGFRDVIWNGDAIAWKNLLKRYVFCLDRLVSILSLSGEEHEITSSFIPINTDIKELPTPEYINRISILFTEFFREGKIDILIKKISQRTSPIRTREVHFYISAIHFYALDVILKNMNKHGFPTKPLNFNTDHLLKGELFKNLEAVLDDNKHSNDISDALFLSASLMQEQLKLIEQYNRSEKIITKNKNFVFSDFPTEFINTLTDFIYPPWYAACFMSKCRNSSVWAHYGESHSGVSLIFTSNVDKNGPHIKLERINGYSSNIGKTTGMVRHNFHPIIYTKSFPEIFFFNSLGRMPKSKLKSIWFTDENGKHSSSSDLILNSTDKWREKYWEDYHRGTTTKLQDWDYEKEYRLILSGEDIHDFSDPKDRVLKYDFSSLEGVIFGINTKLDDKIKILSIVEKKCKENNRKHFKFYQAYYSGRKSCIDTYELDLLHFS